IEERRAAADEIVCERRRSELLCDCRLQEFGHRRSSRIDAIWTDHVQNTIAGDLLFPSAGCVAGGWVVNNRVSGKIAEITCCHCTRGQRPGIRPSQLPLSGALVIDEKEQLISLDGPAERAAKLVLIVSVLFWEPGEVRLEVVTSGKVLVEMEFMGAAVERVRPRFDYHVHGCTARLPLLGIERVRN